VALQTTVRELNFSYLVFVSFGKQDEEKPKKEKSGRTTTNVQE